MIAGTEIAAFSVAPSTLRWHGLANEKSGVERFLERFWERLVVLSLFTIDKMNHGDSNRTTSFFSQSHSKTYHGYTE
jgi:hypothetical protein